MVTRSPRYQLSLAIGHRANRCSQITDFFFNNLGKRVPSPWLHGEFGTSFRARVAEINADACSPILIRNENHFDEEFNREVSAYWAELRPRHKDLG